MKVLHLTSSLKVGGAESLLVDLVRQLKTENMQNYVLYFHDGPNSELLKKLSIDCFQIKGLFKMYDPVFLFNLLKTIKKINPDCIHASLWSANLLGTIAAKILKIPILTSIHLASNLEKETQDSRFRSLLDRISFSSDKIIVVSNSVRNQLILKFPSLKKKLEVILNGVDTDSIACAKKLISPELSHSIEKFIIGSVGRFIARKNHKLLIESFYELKKFEREYNIIFELHLVGQGPLENELKKLVQDLKLFKSVKFIKTDNAREVYNTFDCFILPSEQEGLSIALLEAMASELPVIVCSQLKHDVIINYENGLVVDLSKYQILKAIRTILEDDILRVKMSQNARALIYKEYSLLRMAKDYYQAYKALCR
jgi:glycosyltransferase EpsF